MGEIFSDETLRIPQTSEANTATDMAEAFRWKLGDPEPKGTHAKANVALRNLRDDMRRGKAMAQSYENNYILVDIFKPIAPQLEELK